MLRNFSKKFPRIIKMFPLNLFPTQILADPPTLNVKPVNNEFPFSGMKNTAIIEARKLEKQQ